MCERRFDERLGGRVLACEIGAFGELAMNREGEVPSVLPGARAELARLLVGTPSEPSEAEGASGEGRAATSVEEPPEGTPGKPVLSPAARERDLRLRGVIS